MANNQSKMALVERPIDVGATKQCDVPFCEKCVVPSMMFEDRNITCMRCQKFHCDDCTKQIWTGEWQGQTFYKPKVIIPFLKHEVWQCAFCRASFDRMLPCDEETSFDA